MLDKRAFCVFLKVVYVGCYLGQKNESLSVMSVGKWHEAADRGSCIRALFIKRV